MILTPPFGIIRALLDAIDDWAPDPSEPGEIVAAEVEQAGADALEDPTQPGAPPHAYPVVDLEARASSARYRTGKLKRTYCPKPDLSKRRISIALHQAGVVRSEARWLKSAGGVTCHRAIGPTGNRYRVHPLDVALVATNRFNRSPWHTIAIEVLNNLKGTPNGRHYKPEIFGAGTLGPAQAEACRQEVAAIVAEVEALGFHVVGIVPHRIAGIGSNGKPNRPICPGFEIWSQVGEWAGAVLGLPIPREGWTVGGLPIPKEWHGPYHLEASKRTIVT